MRVVTLARMVCQATSSMAMAMHHPNLWQLRYAGSVLQYRVSADLTTFNLRLAFLSILTALPLQFIVLHITKWTVAQMKATS
jgi:hypothetical protein